MTALLTRLRQLDAAATPPGWEVVRYGDGDSLVITDETGDWRVCFMATPGQHGSMDRIEASAALITTLRNHLPEIIAALERVEASDA